MTDTTCNKTRPGPCPSVPANAQGCTASRAERYQTATEGFWPADQMVERFLDRREGP